MVHRNINVSWHLLHFTRCEFESRSGEVYSIQHYMIKFISDLRQVSGFLRARRFPAPIKLPVMI